MKLFFLFICFYCSGSYAQQSIYDYRIETNDGNKITLSAFKGSKILIVTASPDILEQSAGRYLDSLGKVFPSLKVIVIPASDFGGNRNAEILANEKGASNHKYIVMALTATKKDKGDAQHPLCLWLNSSTQNTHFDTDVAADLQLYVISESGILYSVLEKGWPDDLLSSVLKQSDVKE